MDDGSLALTVVEGERVEVNGPASVRLVRVAGNRVRLHIVAPKSTRILRGKVADRIASSAEGAANDERPAI